MNGLPPSVLMEFRRREGQRRLLALQFRREFALRGWPERFQQDGPREGETKWENGRQYVFHGSRWHRVESPIGVSPNTEENLSFEESVRRLQSERHRAMKERFLMHAKHVVGEPSQVLDVVGDWKDGSENSVLIRWDRPVPFDQLGYAAAHMGLDAEQKAVVWLSGDPQGPDRYYRFVSQVPVEELRERLADTGFFAWSLDLRQQPRLGVHLLVEGEDGQALITRFQEKHEEVIVPGSDLMTPGRVGSIEGESREKAAELFRKVIEEYESRFRSSRMSDPEKRREIIKILEERRKKALALVAPGPDASWDEKKLYAIRRSVYGSGRPVDLERMERLQMRNSMAIAHRDAKAANSGPHAKYYPSVILPLQAPRKRG